MLSKKLGILNNCLQQAVEGYLRYIGVDVIAIMFPISTIYSYLDLLRMKSHEEPQQSPLKKKRRSTINRYRRTSFVEMDYSFLQSDFFTKEVDEVVGDRDHEMSSDEMQGILNKFVSSVNLLYFDDVAVAKRMDGVVKKEIEQNLTGG